MKKGFGLTMCLLGLTAAAAAQANDQPVYDADDETLTIPSVTAEGQPGFFQEIMLAPASDGTWRVDQLYEGELLEEDVVDAIWTTSTAGLPRQFYIHVEGTFPTDCPAVGQIEQMREGNTFHVYVYYENNQWLRDPDSVACAQVLTPFEFTVPLDIYGVEAGEYSVRINNHDLRTFVLEQDNIGPDQFAGERRQHCQYEPVPLNGFAAYACADDSDLILQ